MSAEAAPPYRRFSLTDFSICLALFLATCATYLPASRLDFIRFDDPAYVTYNKHLAEGFTWRGLNWAFTSYDPDNWFPLTRLSHMLDYALFGLNGPAHHDVNILFHALATLLLYAFLRRATSQPWPSAFVAAVFALHPLHVESVAWVSERKDVLCAFFWFTTLWSWVRYTERPSKTRYVLTLLLFAAGLMSKPMIVTLPLLLPVLDLWPLRRPFSRRTLLLQLPFWALSAADAALTVLAQKSVGFVRSLDEFSLTTRVENAVSTVFIYIGKTFWPLNLSIQYGWPAHQSFWLAVLAAISIIGITVVVLAMRSQRPYLAAGWLWFLITLLPVIGLVQVGSQARADRYMYVPMVGLLIMVAWGAAEILHLVQVRAAKQLNFRSWPVAATTALALVICLSLSTLSRAQQQYWDSTESLFRHAIAINGENYLAWLDLGEISNRTTELKAKIECYRIAAGIRPDLPEIHAQLGKSLLQAGRAEEAVTEFQTILRLRPPNTKIQCLLGTALLKEGRFDDAISQFELAVRSDPSSAMAHDDLAISMWRAMKYKAATRHELRVDEIEFQLERAIALRPDDNLARNNLGLILLDQPGGLTGAHQYFIQALAVNPEDIAAHLGLARSLTMPPFSDPAAAEDHSNSAHRLQPDPETLRQFEAPQTDGGQPR